MNQNLLSRVLEFLRRKMWSKRWQRAVTCFSAFVVFCVTYALILPAITMTGKYPVLSAETLTAWTGDELTVRVSAETALEDGGKTVVLTLEGEGADLSEKYVFNDEGVCVVLDEEENEILLHRAIREDAKNTVDYWFDMEPGTKTVFALDLADKVDVTRFAETMEAVKQSGEEAKPETQKATAADAGKSAVAAEEAKTASASNAARTEKVSAAVTASGSNADIEAVNQEAKTSEEKVLAESHDNGFVEILDGQVMNDLEEQENEEATEIVAEMKVSAGIGGDYEKAVADAGKNADKRGDAQLKLRWKDAVLGTNSVNELTAAAEGAVIAVFFDEEAGIPQGAVLSVEEIDESTGEYQEYLGQASAALKDAGADDSEDSIRNITHARFFDITIRDADGNEIEPKSAVKVVVSYNDVLEITEDGSLDVLHFTGSEPEVLKPAEMSGEKLVDGFSFSAETFSVYGIVGTETLTAAHFTADGKTYEVSVKCGAGAAIPKGAKLLVSEVTKDDLGYDTYKEQTAELVQKDASALSYLKMLDISIVDENGIEITPAVPVDVQIRLLDKKEGNETRVIHIGESAEELDGTADGKMVQFATPGFSIFVFVDIDELPVYSLTQSFENEKFRITAAYSEKAGIPENAEFRFAEITPETDGVRYEERKALLSQYYGDREFLIKELLNMGFWKKAVSGDDSEDQTEEEIEPAEPVLIAITLKDADLNLAKNRLEFVHFAENGLEVIAPETERPQGLQEEQENPRKAQEGQEEQAAGEPIYLKVDSFSDFALVDDPNHPGQKTVEHNPPEHPTDEELSEFVHKAGSKTDFLENLPYGTCYVDYDAMEMARYNFPKDSSGEYEYTVDSDGNHVYTGTYTGTDGFTYTCVVKITPAGSNLLKLKGTSRIGVGYITSEMAPIEEKQVDGLAFTVEFDNVAYLHDGRLANVMVTVSNTYVKNTDPDKTISNSGAIYYGHGMLPSAGGDPARIYGSFDLNIKVVEEGEDLSDESFLYGMQDIDIDSKISFKDTFKIAVNSEGTGLVGIKLYDSYEQPSKYKPTIEGYGTLTRWNEGGSTGIPEGYPLTGTTEEIGRYYSLPITEDSEKVPLYDVDGAPLYFKEGTDHELTRDVSEAKKDGAGNPIQGYPLYKTAMYVRNVKKSPYVGGGAGQDDGKAHFRFWLLTMDKMQPESETVKKDGVLGKIYVPETNWLHIWEDENGYNFYGTRNDDSPDPETGEENVGSFDSGYFLLANAEKGLTFTARCAGGANSFLTNSRMSLLLVSRTYPGGTISTDDTNYEGKPTAYGIHRGGDETGYSEGYLAVPYNKAGVTYDMTPDTFYHIKAVQIWDGINSEYPDADPSEGQTPYTSGRIYLDDETKWVNNKFTHTTQDGRVYEFTRDANGVVSYVFNDVSVKDPSDNTGVKKDHYIYVWWEKDPTVESVKLIKKWDDNGNASNARPDASQKNAITMHLVRSDGGRVNPVDEEGQVPAKYELVTGTDPSYQGSLVWKDNKNDTWEYVYEVDKLATNPNAIFRAWEDAIPDYACKPGRGNDGRDRDHKKDQDATVIYDPVTRMNIYTVTIENKLKNGSVSFNKQDQFGRPVAGAEFTLFTNADCDQPTGGYKVATSSNAGVVTFSDIPCGTYYMKETNVPENHSGDKTKVYRVTIHAADNPDPSTIVPGKVENHIFTPDASGTPISDIDNPVDTGDVKVTKTVIGDAAAKNQPFSFIADFGTSMAGKTIKAEIPDPPGTIQMQITLDQAGKYTFTLKDGGSITFLGLPHGLEYTITETAVPGYTTSVVFDPANSQFTISGAEATGIIDKSQLYTVAYTNKLEPDIIIRKTDSSSVPQSLAGSKFKLYRHNGQMFELMLPPGNPQGEYEFEIPEDGRPWEDLEPGLYKLEEVLAPAGYVIVNRETEFTVKIPTPEDNNYIAVSEGVTWAVITASDTIAIRNQKGVELPETGGPGTLAYTLSGIALLLASALMYGFRMRHGERRTM